MAIHIRHRRETLARMRRKLMRLCFMLTLTCLLTVGCCLYFTTELRMQTVPSFTGIAYVPESGGESHRAAKSETPRTATSSLAPRDTAPDIILAETADAATLDEIALGDFETEENEGEAGSGLGEHGAAGKGKGRSHGNRYGDGLNDDLQIVLALDASASMDYLFAAVSESMERMVQTLRRSKVNGRPAKVHLGLIAYGSSRRNGAPWRLMDFSTDAQALRRSLKGIVCDGAEENCGEAIAYAESHFAWNRRAGNRALKVIIIAGNEAFDQGKRDFREAIADLRRSGIILNTLHCGSARAESEQWKAAAELGGGIYAELPYTQRATDSEKRLAAAKEGQILRRMAALPLYPFGSAEEQAEHRRCADDMRQNLPTADTPLPSWVETHAPWLRRGAEWDAAECFRREGDKALLNAEGTWRADAPEELRDLPLQEALQRLRETADQRTALLEELRPFEQQQSDPGLKILHALQQQAAACDIDITL